MKNIITYCRNTFIILAQLGIFLFDIFLLVFPKYQTYQSWCYIGLINIMFSSYFLILSQKKILTPTNIIFAFFCLFQFGIPLIFTFDNSYANEYLSLFDLNTLFQGTYITTISINLFALGLIIPILFKKRIHYTIPVIEYSIDNNPKIVLFSSTILFIVSSVIIFPCIIDALLLQISSNDFTIAYRDVLSKTALRRFGMEYFFNSAICILIFTQRKILKYIIITLYIIICIIFLLLANRATGLINLFVLVLMKILFIEDEKNKLKSIIIIFPSIFIFSIIAIIISCLRIDYSLPNNLFDLFIAVFEELGFNFTTICFLISYIKDGLSITYGLTYLSSILRILPKSFDIFHIFKKPQFMLGEEILFSVNHIKYDGKLDFGVGYSLIGEAYYNFGALCFIIIFLLGVLFSFMLNSNIDTKWNHYCKVIVFSSLVMLPRQQLYVFIKKWEYGIFFMGIFLFISIVINNICKRGNTK